VEKWMMENWNNGTLEGFFRNGAVLVRGRELMNERAGTERMMAGQNHRWNRLFWILDFLISNFDRQAPREKKIVSPYIGEPKAKNRLAASCWSRRGCETI
jgi:hypothetical protein